METTVWVGDRTVGVDGPRKLDAMRTTPPNPKTAQTATRQPTIQTVGTPDLGAILAVVAVLAGGCAPVVVGGGKVCTVDACCTVSRVSSACFQAATKSPAVAKRSFGSFTSALRMTCSIAGGSPGLT